MKNIKLHEMIQSYLDKLYHPFAEDIKHSKLPKGNQIYGELYYYSFLELLDHISITQNDHILDIGSGLGKIVFQMYLTTRAGTVTGIEINHERHVIASLVKKKMQYQLPELFQTSAHRKLSLLEGDFLELDFPKITMIYLCSTAFCFELLEAMGNKMNEMDNVRKIISFRKIPGLENFNMTQKIFLPATWDNVACYFYTRK